MGKYTIAGHCKTTGKYFACSEHASFEDAVKSAKPLGLKCRKESIDLSGNTIDWIEIFENWNTPNQKTVWGSYDLCVESCANV